MNRIERGQIGRTKDPRATSSFLSPATAAVISSLVPTAFHPTFFL